MATNDTCHITYDGNVDEFRIDFEVDDYRCDVEANFCEYVMACRVPKVAAKDARDHTWQLVACWDAASGKGKNRRIGYVPTDLAKVLDEHLANKRLYANEGSWPRWDVRLTRTYTDAETARLKAFVELRIYAQDYHRLADSFVDGVFDRFDVDEIEPEVTFDTCEVPSAYSQML